MSPSFDPRRKAYELPQQTLVDLWRRTAVAHTKLRATWHAAVSEAYGKRVAELAAIAGWPRLAAGASDKELFYDDLRFIVAACELQPSMLTVARNSRGELPKELSAGRSWFGTLVTASARRHKATKPRREPAWVGSPGRLAGRLRGSGIQIGFTLLLKAWQASQGKRPLPFDVDDFERKVATDLDEETLALLWNHAALAYMLGTDRWYTQVEKRYGDEAARRLEKEVWVERGAAEHDLQIGLDAMGVEGRDVESLLRGFQFAPGEVGIINVDFELKGEDRGVLTHRTCPALDRFEHFDEKRRQHCCDICLSAMPISGEMLSKKIKCTPLKLPPRKDANDIACRWAFTRVPE